MKQEELKSYLKWWVPRIKTELSSRSDNHEEKYKVVLVSNNLIKDGEFELPGLNKRDFYHFDSGVSVIYYLYDKGKVNTRIVVYNSNDGSNRTPYFCKLTLFQKILLPFVERRTIYHKNPFHFFCYCNNITVIHNKFNNINFIELMKVGEIQ